jgi:hypothetical protein
MTPSLSTVNIAADQASIPPWLVRICLVLAVANLTLCGNAYFSQWWVYDRDGLGIPTDFINVWAAGRLVLDGLPAQAYDWDVQKQVEVAKLGQDFVGYFAWHYPPPFLFVASLLAQLPYKLASAGSWSAFCLFWSRCARLSATPSAFCSRLPLRWSSSMHSSVRTDSSRRR